jgi:hypothetical protein
MRESARITASWFYDASIKEFFIILFFLLLSVMPQVSE